MTVGLTLSGPPARPPHRTTPWLPATSPSVNDPSTDYTTFERPANYFPTDYSKYATYGNYKRAIDALLDEVEKRAEYANYGKYDYKKYATYGDYKREAESKA